MSEHERVKQARRKMIRYRLLKILDAGRPTPLGEGLIKQVLVDVDLGASLQDVRKAMQYLSDKKFLAITQERDYWLARLLPTGVDFLENPDASDNGISKPEDFS